MSDQGQRHGEEIDQKLREIEWQIERDEEEPIRPEEELRIRQEEKERKELDHPIYPRRMVKTLGPWQ